ncbi:MAG: GntR family transcriptional regulator [Bacteroidales bacterium]|jgi:predicted RNA-binding protein (virulence factor B family)|nr:GntR family transcriptional regulator [Bacteroidales bacterium]
MIKIGTTNILKVIKVDGENITFDAQELGQIVAINNDFIRQIKVDDEIEVFLYPDGENVKACIGDAFANIGEFVFLTVVANTSIGSFFDWGIDKDLFCPFSEQITPLIVDKSYLVYVFTDEKTNRPVASTKIQKFISEEKPDFEEKSKVNVLIIKQTDLGYSVIVENKFRGLLYNNEIYNEITIGEIMPAYVKKIREDNKIDVRLQQNDTQDIIKFEDVIIDYLRKNNNIMTINDNSEPEIIKEIFGISKKNFKKTIGALYKRKLIVLENETIKLVKKND